TIFQVFSEIIFNLILYIIIFTYSKVKCISVLIHWSAGFFCYLQVIAIPNIRSKTSIMVKKIFNNILYSDSFRIHLIYLLSLCIITLLYSSLTDSSEGWIYMFIVV